MHMFFRENAAGNLWFSGCNPHESIESIRMAPVRDGTRRWFWSTHTFCRYRCISSCCGIVFCLGPMFFQLLSDQYSNFRLVCLDAVGTTLPSHKVQSGPCRGRSGTPPRSTITSKAWRVARTDVRFWGVREKADWLLETDWGIMVINYQMRFFHGFP